MLLTGGNVYSSHMPVQLVHSICVKDPSCNGNLDRQLQLYLSGNQKVMTASRIRSDKHLQDLRVRAKDCSKGPFARYFFCGKSSFVKAPVFNLGPYVGSSHRGYLMSLSCFNGSRVCLSSVAQPECLMLNGDRSNAEIGKSYRFRHHNLI